MRGEDEFAAENGMQDGDHVAEFGDAARRSGADDGAGISQIGELGIDDNFKLGFVFAAFHNERFHRREVVRAVNDQNLGLVFLAKTTQIIPVVRLPDKHDLFRCLRSQHLKGIGISKEHQTKRRHLHFLTKHY